MTIEEIKRNLKGLEEKEQKLSSAVKYQQIRITNLRNLLMHGKINQDGSISIMQIQASIRILTVRLIVTRKQIRRVLKAMIQGKYNNALNNSELTDEEKAIRIKENLKELDKLDKKE